MIRSQRDFAPHIGRKRESQIQNLKTRLKSNIQAIIENYELIIQRSKLEGSDGYCKVNPYTQAEMDNFEIRFRVSNIVNACENLTKLINELKQVLILGDFCWIEEVTKSGIADRRQLSSKLNTQAARLKNNILEDISSIEEELATGYFINKNNY